jgi:hypothetical protein
LTVGDAPSDASLKSDDLLHKASEIEQKQKEKVARAAIKLEKEEANEKAVRIWSSRSNEACFYCRYTYEQKSDIILLYPR